RLSKLRIGVSEKGVTVLRGGTEVKPEELGTDVPVDPGVVLVEARAPGKRPWSARVDLRHAGASERVLIPPLASLPSPARSSRSGSPLAAIGWTGVGVGVASLGASLAVGALARSKQRDADRGHCGADDVCDATGLSLRADALTASYVSTALFAVGLAAAGA